MRGYRCAASSGEPPSLHLWIECDGGPVVLIWTFECSPNSVDADLRYYRVRRQFAVIRLPADQQRRVLGVIGCDGFDHTSPAAAGDDRPVVDASQRSVVMTTHGSVQGGPLGRPEEPG